MGQHASRPGKPNRRSVNARLTKPRVRRNQSAVLTLQSISAISTRPTRRLLYMMGGVNDDDQPPKKYRPADDGANDDLGDFGDAMTYNSGSADHGGGYGGGGSADYGGVDGDGGVDGGGGVDGDGGVDGNGDGASDNRSALAVMHHWLRNPTYKPAKHMMAEMLGLQHDAATHRSARFVQVEWLSGIILERNFQLPDFDTVQQTDQAYLCSYVRNIQSRLLRCIPADLANESDAPENVALFLGHGGASVSTKEMIYSNTLDQKTMTNIVELATTYNRTLVFTRSDWLAEVKQVVDQCMPGHKFSNNVLTVKRLACARPNTRTFDIPAEVNMYRNVSCFVIETGGQVVLADLSVMNPAKLLLAHGGHYVANWPSLDGLQCLSCWSTYSVNWPTNLNITELYVDADRSFQQAEWWNWTSLEKMHLQSVDMQKLPDDVSKLVDLRTLKLVYMSNLTAISHKLKECKQMTHIKLEKCDRKLRGRLALPSSVTHINISFCKFETALLHDVAVQCYNLRKLKIAATLISSSRPPELFDLLELQILKLTSCNLQGTISTDFAKLTKLQKLDLSQNHLTGSVPQEVIQLPMLEQLTVNLNKSLTGTVTGRPNLRILAYATGIQVI